MCRDVMQALTNVLLVTLFFFAGFAAIKAAVTNEPLMLVAGSVGIWVAWKVA